MLEEYMSKHFHIINSIGYLDAHDSAAARRQPPRETSTPALPGDKGYEEGATGDPKFTKPRIRDFALISETYTYRCMSLLHAYVHTYIPTYIHTYIALQSLHSLHTLHTLHTYLPTYLPTYTHAYTHAHT